MVDSAFSKNTVYTQNSYFNDSFGPCDSIEISKISGENPYILDELENTSLPINTPILYSPDNKSNSSQTLSVEIDSKTEANSLHSFEFTRMNCSRRLSIQYNRKLSVEPMSPGLHYAARAAAMPPVEEEIENVFKIKNLDTGEAIDLRDENQEAFTTQFARLTSRDTCMELEDFFRRKRELNTALWEAAETNDYKLCKQLLDPQSNSGIVAQPNSKGLNDWTALHIAADKGHLDICEILLFHGELTNLNAKTSLNRTPLHLACIKGHLYIVELFIREEANVNCLDDEHNTPLHYAAMYNHTQIVKKLIKHKANPGIRNLKGLYPYDISGSASVAKVFKRYGKRKPAACISCGYGRIVCNGVIFYNSRVDIVNKLVSYANPIPKDSDLNRKQIKKLEKEYPQISKKLSIEYNEQADLRKAGPEDFDPIGMLGKGSFGEVYLVRERRTQKLYALKLLRKDEIISTNIVRYIFTERNILSSIKHPFIVSLYTSFQTQDKLVLVMDYCPGGDLGSYLVREGKFTEERARIYLCEILLALQELHNNGIIFRDLKPENIVLDTEGHAILTDFGLSKEGVRFGQLQRSFCGSIAYMAPEMLKKKGHDKNVDWYLLGTLLYEMLHGVPPYYCDDQDQLFQNILKAKLTFSNEISSRAVDLLKKLLNRNSAKRLGSGRRDAEEIMEHHFFRGIDWDAVRRRKLKPPPPICYNKKLRKVDNRDIFGKSKHVHEEEDRLVGWSFYNGPAKIV